MYCQQHMALPLNYPAVPGAVRPIGDSSVPKYHAEFYQGYEDSQSASSPVVPAWHTASCHDFRRSSWRRFSSQPSFNSIGNKTRTFISA